MKNEMENEAKDTAFLTRAYEHAYETRAYAHAYEHAPSANAYGHAVACARNARAWEEGSGGAAPGWPAPCSPGGHLAWGAGASGRQGWGVPLTACPGPGKRPRVHRRGHRRP
jgi:hypothetical protein